MSKQLQRACAARLALSFVLCTTAIFCGCDCRYRGHYAGVTTPNVTAPQPRQSKPPAKPLPEVPPQPAEQPVEQPREVAVEPPAEEPKEEPVDPAVVWNDLLKQTEECLRREELDQARQNLARLKDIELQLNANQEKGLAVVRTELERLLGDRELRAAVRTLASDKPEEVRSAQDLLFERSGAALPLLRESVRDTNPLMVRNTLQMLRLLQRPEVALPIMVDVLRRPEQKENWPDAVRQIGLCGGPGAGGPLLQLAAKSDLPEQRIAALTALASVVDPPRTTVTDLLPSIFRDGPELAAVLQAAGHGLVVNRQHGLLTGRGLESAPTAEQLAQFGALPERLSAIIAGDASDPPGPAAAAAKMLAIATRSIPAEPLLGVKVLAYTAEQKEGPVARVLDGQWNTVQNGQCWRHPAKPDTSIVLDLGRSRTVAGVRIWNLNEQNASHRGWKDIAICVGPDTATLVTPVTQGIVAQAPGKQEIKTDYSTTIPIGFARGRYVRLQAKSFWRPDSYAGLTEVQILGF